MAAWAAFLSFVSSIWPTLVAGGKSLMTFMAGESYGELKNAYLLEQSRNQALQALKQVEDKNLALSDDAVLEQLRADTAQRDKATNGA